MIGYRDPTFSVEKGRSQAMAVELWEGIECKDISDAEWLGDMGVAMRFST